MRQAYIHPNDLKTWDELLTDALAKLKPDMRAWLTRKAKQDGYEVEDYIMLIVYGLSQDPLRWQVMSGYTERVQRRAGKAYGHA